MKVEVWFLSLVLCACGWMAGSPAEAEICGLTHELDAVTQHCDQDPDACAWFDMLRVQILGEDWRAEAMLVESFGLPASEAKRLREASAKWIPLLFDEATCSYQDIQPLLDATLAGQAQGEPESSLFWVRLLGMSSTVVDRLLTDRPPALRQRLSRVIEAFVRLAAPVDAVNQALVLLAPSIESLKMPPVESWPPELVDLAPRLDGVDRVLEELASAKEGDFFQRIVALTDGAARSEPAMVWARAGIGLATRGDLEAAAMALHLAEDQFREAEPLGGEARMVRILAGGYRALLSRLWKLDGDAARIFVELEVGASPLEAWWLQAIAQAPLSSREEARAAEEGSAKTQELRTQELMSRMMAGEFAAEDLDAMKRGLLIAWPGAASSESPTSQTFDFPQLPASLQITQDLLEGDLERALGRFDQLTASSKHLEHLKWPAWVAVGALRQGRVEEARAALERGLGYLEQQLARQRVDDVSRASVDDYVRVFTLALDLAFEMDAPGDAFDYAERARAYTLRRLLVAPPGGGHRGVPSRDERQLDDEVVKHLKAEVSAAGGPAAAESMSRFEAERLKRLLRAVREPSLELESVSGGSF